MNKYIGLFDKVEDKLNNMSQEKRSDIWIAMRNNNYNELDKLLPLYRKDFIEMKDFFKTLLFASIERNCVDLFIKHYKFESIKAMKEIGVEYKKYI